MRNRKKMSTTLSSKHQISIPEEVRFQMGWEAGQQLAFIPKKNGVMLVPVPTFDELIGIAKGANTNDFRDRSDRY